MRISITNFWKLFNYSAKRYHYKKCFAIRELSKRLDLDLLNNYFLTDTGPPSKSIPLLDEVDDGETVSTCHALHFCSSDSQSTEVINISDLTINNTLSSAYNLVKSTIGSQHTSEKEGAK